MAGRIRSIKPELLEDDVTSALSSDAWRSFVSMLLLADDYGNFRANPKLLEGAIFWNAPGRRDWAALRQELHRLIYFWEVDGQIYGHVRGWDKHQKVDRPGKPRCPGPPAGNSGPIHEDAASRSPESREPAASESRDPREPLANNSRIDTTCKADSRGPRVALATDQDQDLRPGPTTTDREQDRCPPPEVREPRESSGTEDAQLAAIFARVPGGDSQKLVQTLRQLELTQGKPTSVTLVAIAQQAVAELAIARSGSRKLDDPGPYLSRILGRLLRPGELAKTLAKGEGKAEGKQPEESFLDREHRRLIGSPLPRGEASIGEILGATTLSGGGRGPA